METKILPSDLFGTEVSGKNPARKKPVAKSSGRKKLSASKKLKSVAKTKTKSKSGKKAAAPKKAEVKAKSVKISKPVEKKAKNSKKKKPIKKKITTAKAVTKKPATKRKKAVKKTTPPKKRVAAGKQKAKKTTAPKKRVSYKKPKIKKTPPSVGKEKFIGADEAVEYYEEEPRVPCPACGEPVHPQARVCIHCGAPYITCPYCGKESAALYDPKMATEQRLNKIFKQYTLFSLALPAMPMQPIMNCSSCRGKLILCEECRTPMKVGARSCPSCGFNVRRTKLLINPFSLFDAVFRRPDIGKSMQRALGDVLRSLSEW